MDNYRQVFRSAIARVYHQNGAVVGAGFLVSSRYILTCAHVVTTALGVISTENLPSDLIELDFPLISPGQKIRDSHLTAPVELEKVLAQCDSDTSVLLVSDAGAARGYRRMERIRAITEFLVKLKQRTSLICWLNPMPKEPWESSSAEVIGYLVVMEQMNDTGMSNAIDVVRGL